MALRLLNETDRPLKEIAHALSFSEPSAFSRAAKKWFGMAPKEIRSRSARAKAREQVAAKKVIR
jgi:AraC-like DNA-binding protein